MRQWIVIGVLIVIIVATLWIGPKLRNMVQYNTWDYYTNQRLAELHPSIRGDMEQAINKVQERHGIKVRIGKDGHFRSFDLQRELYNDYQDGGPLAAPPGRSYHNYGLAADLYIIENNQVDYSYEKYQKVADIMQEHGFDWGYEMWGKDKPHFQKTFGYSTDDLAAKRKAQGRGKYLKLA